MKNYETTGRTEYYALIRAKDLESAEAAYIQEVDPDSEELTEFLEFKEVSDEYVMQAHRNLNDDQFAEGEMEEILEQARQDLNRTEVDGPGIIMLIDGDLI